MSANPFGGPQEIDMPKEVLAALVTAVAAIVLSVWSLATARFNRSLVLAAEERAKRGELTRIKALEAIDTFLDALADLLEVVGGLRFLIRHGGSVSMDSPAVRDGLKRLAEKRAAIARLRIRSAQYLTSQILNEFDDISESTETLDMQKLEDIDRRLRDVSRMVAYFSRDRYLS